MTRGAAAGTLLLTSMILAVWPLIEQVFPLRPEQILAIALAALGSLILDLIRTLADQQAPEVGNVQHLAIGDCLRSVFEKGATIRRVRILASTSEIILPIIRDVGPHIQSCQVALQEFDPSSDAKSQFMYAKTEGLIGTWKDLTRQGVIARLVIKRIDFLPSAYYIIVDDQYLVFGLFFPTTLSSHAVDFVEPMLVDDQTNSNKLFIQKCVNQFDLIFERYPTYAEVSPGPT